MKLLNWFYKLLIKYQEMKIAVMLEKLDYYLFEAEAYNYLMNSEKEQEFCDKYDMTCDMLYDERMYLMELRGKLK